MGLTKERFDQIPPGDIFRIVSQRVNENGDFDPSRPMTKFVCFKSKDGKWWDIRSALGTAHADDIARYGEELNGKEAILSICPCDEEVLELYRP